MVEPVRWGILGCAQIAIHRVIPGMQLADQAVPTAVASRSLEKAQHTASQFGIAKAYGSYEALLADASVTSHSRRDAAQRLS